MKKLLILACLILAGCDESAQIREQRDSDTARALYLVKNSVVTCSDGNVVRVVASYVYSPSGSLSVWTVLNDDGKPKKCRLRPRTTPVQYEEVPQ